jgi:anti-sigma B factor antagonist
MRCGRRQRVKQAPAPQLASPTEQATDRLRPTRSIRWVRAKPGTVIQVTHSGFRIDIRDTERVLRLTLHGELDLATVPQVHEAVREHCGSGRDALIVDLSGLSFMDSAGIRLLLQLQGREDGTAVRFVAPNAQVGRVLDMTGIRDHLHWDTSHET